MEGEEMRCRREAEEREKGIEDRIRYREVEDGPGRKSGEGDRRKGRRNWKMRK